MAGLSADHLQHITSLVNRIASDEFLPEDVFPIILDVATKLTRSDVGSIHLMDAQKSALRLAAIKGAPQESIGESAYSIEHSFSGSAARRGKSIIVQDVTRTPGYKVVFPDVRSELIVPIIAGHTVVGVINLESKEISHFTDEDSRIIELVASLLASAIRSGDLNRLRSQLPSPSDKDQNREVAFVLMPFHEPFNKYYKNIFKPAVVEVGLRSLRADEIFGPSQIMQDVWGSIHDARIVLAELTGRNPNVMYEVGLSHGIGKPVILVSQSMDDVPFDLRALRCVLYDTTDTEWAAQLRSNLVLSIQSALSVGGRGPFQRR